MPFCPHCGNEVERVPEVAAVAETVSADVRIAEINAKRDIEVARIQARSERDWNETNAEVRQIEAEAEVAVAEATAEIIGDVITAEVDSDAETEDDPAPIVVTAEPDDGGEDLAPPVAEPVSTPKPKAAWSFS